MTSERKAKLHGAITRNEKSSWFGVRLVFSIGAGKRSKWLTVHDDRWLLNAGSAEDAYAEAMAGAKAAQRMGRALAEGDQSSLEAAGLNHYAEIFSPMAPASKTKLANNKHVQAKLNGTYTSYDFLGFADLHVVGKELKHGTEVDRDLIELDASEQTIKFPSKRALLAFDPSGPAYRGKVRKTHNAELFERYKWYLAEAVFQLLDTRRRKCKMVRRFILVRANGPQHAYDSALVESKNSDVTAVGAFKGLKQLSLIADDFRNACILRTDQYSVSPTQLRELIHTKSQLPCFKNKSESL